MKKLYKIRLIVIATVLFLTILAFWGLYPLHFLSAQFTPLVQSIKLNHSLFAMVLLALIFVCTLIFGRCYCSTFCPFGLLQELANLTYNKIRKKPPKPEYIRLTPFKYFISAVTFGLLIGGSTLLIRYVDPFTIFGSLMSFTLYGVIFTFVILSVVFFKNRLVCSSICPVGAILGLLARFSLLKIYIDDNCVNCKTCTRFCSSKCINPDKKEVNNENCVKCLKCTSVCPKGAIKYGIKFKKPKFSINKRMALISISAGTLFLGAYAAGVKFSKKLYSKIKDVILPPGAGEIQKMANRCLNCNLCIKNCPQGILAKANEEYPFVHIDYSSGKHYCKYDCKKCSSVCPSGAIKKITLKQKQNTRIAIAVCNDNCIACGACAHNCPKGAISFEGGLAQVDSSKCIGCGRCKAVCPMNAVEIYEIKKQIEI